MKVHVETVLSFDCEVPAEELLKEDISLEDYIGRKLDQSVNCDLGSWSLSEPSVTEVAAA
jgi:hypothetical protein